MLAVRVGRVTVTGKETEPALELTPVEEVRPEAEDPRTQVTRRRRRLHSHSGQPHTKSMLASANGGG